MQFKEGVLYEVYSTSDNSGEFTTGFFVMADSENALFHSVTSDGYDNGLVLMKIFDIYKLQFNTAYCESIKKMMQKNRTSIGRDRFRGDNLTKEVLLYSNDKKSIVTIRFTRRNTIDTLGFIYDVSDDYLTVLQVSQSGTVDGYSIARMREVSRISIDTDENLKFRKLIKVKL